MVPQAFKDALAQDLKAEVEEHLLNVSETNHSLTVNLREQIQIDWKGLHMAPY